MNPVNEKMKRYHRVDCRARIVGLAVIGLVSLATAGPAAATPIPLVRWGFDEFIDDPFNGGDGGGLLFPNAENQIGVTGLDILGSVVAGNITLDSGRGTGYPDDPVLRTRFVPGSDVTSLPLAQASFIEIVIEPDFGRTINIERLEFSVGRTGPSTDPAGVAIRHSDNLFSTNLFVGSINEFAPNQDHFAVDFAPGLFETITNVIRFRFFFFGPTPESTIDIDEIAFFGCVQPMDSGEPCSFVPEPSTLLLAAFAAPALFFRRHRPR